MNKESKKFLILFNDLLREKFPDRINVLKFFVDTNKFPSNQKEVIDDLSIKDIQNVLDDILYIIRYYRVDVCYDTIVSDSEKVSKLTKRNVIDSMKNSSFWGDGYPKKLYQDVVEINICTYENRFITLLINKLEIYVNHLYFSALDNVDFIKEKMLINNIDSFDLRLIGEVSSIEEKGEEILSTSYSQKSIDLFAYENMKKKLRMIKSSALYKACNKGLSIGDEINLTNVILKNDMYNKCYRFYNKLRHVMKQNDNIEKYFFNYGVMKLLSAINYQGYETISSKDEYLNIIDEKIEINNLVLMKRDRMLNINSHDNLITINVSMPYESRSNVDVYRNVYSDVLIRLDLMIHDEKEVVDFISEKYKKYHQCIFLTYLNNGVYMNNIINISEKNKDAMVNLERFIYSLTMKLDGIKDIYTKVCPSCGGKEISIINDEYSCDKCRCIWSFVLKNDNDQIWVKRFGK